ncbi:MAG: hypothetical protein HZC55_24495 [Verrucomicrobia bacterium]|nr:hypothetical protein [Verrucomicrobiota bacterium]
MEFPTRRRFLAAATAASFALPPLLFGAATKKAAPPKPAPPAVPGIAPFAIEDDTLVVPAGLYRIGGGREVRVTAAARLAIAPVDIVTVRDEELQLSPEKPGGFFTGTKLAGTRAANIGAFRSLIEESVALRTPAGRPLRPGEDYLVSAPFALLGLGSRPGVTAADKVLATYAHYRQRIDLVAVDAHGAPFLVPGVPHVATPAIPSAPAGATPIATVYRPFGARTLEAVHVFPIVATARDATTTTTRGRVPRTLAKLERGEPVTVACWGDSITVGADVEPSEAWANRLRTELSARFPRARLTHRNHSIGGTKTAQWLHNGNFPGLPKQNPEKCRFDLVLAEKPDLVVMEFLNDITFGEDVLETTYARIHEAFAARGIEWILVTPSQKVPSDFNLAEMKDGQPRLLDAFLRRFADRHGYALADTAARWKHLYREGIPYFALFANAYNHPNAFGHGLFIEEILRCLEG